MSISINVIPLDMQSAPLPTKSTTAAINTTGLNLRHVPRTFPYQSLKRSNHGCFISFVFLSMPEAIAGTNVSATTRDAIRVNATVSARSTKSCLVIPSVKMIGAYTLTVVSVEAKMAPAT